MTGELQSRPQASAVTSLDASGHAPLQIRPGTSVRDGEAELQVADDIVTSHGNPGQTSNEAAGLALAGRLWADAWKQAREGNPKLATDFEKVLRTHLIAHLAATTLPTPDPESRDERKTLKELTEAMLSAHEVKPNSLQDIFAKVTGALGAIKDVIGKGLQYSSEATAVWSGVCVTLQIIEAKDKQTKARRDGLMYVMSRIEWYWALATSFGKQLPGGQLATSQEIQVGKRLVSLYEAFIIFQMSALVALSRKTLVRLGRDLAKIDDWEANLNSLKETEQLVRQDIVDSKVVEGSQLSSQWGRGEAVLKIWQELKSSISEAADTVVQGMKDIEEKKLNDQCLREICAIDPVESMEELIAEKGDLLEKSYRWILKHDNFQQLCGSQSNLVVSNKDIDSGDNDKRILWVSGPPGLGKTMLLGGIVKELKEALKNDDDGGHSTIIACFFLQKGINELGDATSVLRGLLYQIVTKAPHLLKFAREKWGKIDRIFSGPNSFRTLKGVLNEIFLYLQADREKEVILVIDALDECGKQNRGKLADAINDFADRYKHVKWILSSRPEPGIKKELAVSRDYTLLLELTVELLADAVRFYIDDQVEKLVQRDSAFKIYIKTITKHLHEKAGNSFLWVALACKQLRHSDQVARQGPIRKVLEEQFPNGLDTLYERMLVELEERDQREDGLCKKLIGLILVAKTRLTLKEATSLITTIDHVSLSEMTTLLMGCGSFLTIDHNNQIRFVHISAAEFLTKRFFYENLNMEHYSMVDCSLKALSSVLKNDLCDLGEPGALREEIDGELIQQRVAAISYPCIHWEEHITAVWGEHGFWSEVPHLEGMKVQVPQLLTSLKNFFHNKFLNWLECLSLLESYPHGVRVLRGLKTLILNFSSSLPVEQLSEGNQGLQLAAFISDALRFMTAHQTAIKTAPLQVYASALIFSPTESLVRRQYQAIEPDWVETKPHMPSEWDSCLHTFEEREFIGFMAFSSDGLWLVTGSLHGTIRIWDVETGATLNIFKKPEVKEDAEEEDFKIRLIDKPSDIGLRDGHCIALDSKKNRLAAIWKGGTIVIWTLAENHQYLKLKKEWVQEHLLHGDCFNYDYEHRPLPIFLVFSTDGQKLILGCGNEVRVWDVDIPESICRYQTSFRIRSIIPLEDDQVLALISTQNKEWNITEPETASFDRTVPGTSTITHLSLTSGKEKLVYRTPEDYLIMSPNGRLVAVWAKKADLTLRIYDTTNGLFTVITEWSLPWSFADLCFSPDNSRLAGVSGGLYRVWDIGTTECLQYMQSDSRIDFQSPVFSPDGTKLAFILDYKISLHDVQEAQKSFQSRCEVSSFLGNRTQRFDINMVVVSSDGRKVATGSQRGTLEVSDVSSASLTIRKTAPGGIAVLAIAYSRDDKWIASVHEDGTVNVWSAQNLDLYRELLPFPDYKTPATRLNRYILHVTFSQNGAILAGWNGNRACIWHVHQKEFLMQIEKGESSDFHGLSALALSSSGQKVAFASRYSGKISLRDVPSEEGRPPLRIWVPGSRKQRPWIELANAKVESQVFSSDDKKLAVACKFYEVPKVEIHLLDISTGTCNAVIPFYYGTIKRMIFDESYLWTDNGGLHLDWPPTMLANRQNGGKSKGLTIPQRKVGISIKDKRWIKRNGTRMLWLPVGFRWSWGSPLDMWRYTMAVQSQHGYTTSLKLREEDIVPDSQS